MLQLVLAISLLQSAASGNCQDIQDRDKRGFDDLKSIFLDLDADGKPDEITSRVYSEKISARQRRKFRGRPHQSHWITFDLTTSKGNTRRSFFKYLYGTDRADYWVYALVPCDVNKDGRMDLIFYSGDDESDETIVLLNRGGRFIVNSRKHSESSY